MRRPLTSSRPIVRADPPRSRPIDRWLRPLSFSAKITPYPSLLRCLHRLSVATSHALPAKGVALECWA